MGKQAIRILMAQINLTVGAVLHNEQYIIDVIKNHQKSHDVIVFPELTTTGYPPEDLLFRKELHEAANLSLQRILNTVENCHVIIGHPTLTQEGCYNSLSVMHQGRIIATYHKQNLPNYEIFDEWRYFIKGPQKACVIHIKDHAIGFCICEDLWQKGPAEHLIAQGVSTIISINASPFERLKYEKREALLQHYAQQGINIVYINQVYTQDELLFDGQSMCVNASGEICARAPAFEESLATITLDEQGPKGEITPLLNESALLYKALVFATKDYVVKNQFTGALIGLSGGVDSALTLAIAIDALGAQNVHAVMMPSPYTSQMSRDDALEQINLLGVTNYSTLDIDPTFQVIKSTLAQEFSGYQEDITEENIQARIRGMLLMALSNKTSKIVLTTSNKSETAVGYATLYGDMAGGFAVLKDVLKTQVYALCNYRNSLNRVIPERVLTRAPSAELRENQKDADTLPDYTVLDALLTGYIEQNLSPDELVAQGFSKETVARVITLIRKSEYKRKQAAVGPKVSPVAFGKNWRYPITNGFSV